VLTTTAGVTGNFVNLPRIKGDFTGTMVFDNTTDPDAIMLDQVTGVSLVPVTTGLNVNEINVLSGINSGIVNSPANVPLPAQFINFANLTGPAQANALTQLSGEVSTGAERGAFMMMDQFLNLMLDPFVDGRSGNGWFNGVGQPLGFAPDQQAHRCRRIPL
jgi:hypothetical protein